MKKTILVLALSVTVYFAFGQCGPYALSATDSFCSPVLNISGASHAQKIVWNLNGILDTVYSRPIGITVAGGNGSGSAANQLYRPYSVYVDTSGNIFVADNGNNRIQKFPAGSTSATNGITVAGGNGAGSAANQLDQPACVYLDGSGNIYVADFNNHRIQKFPAGSTYASSGITVAGGNGPGTAADQLTFPTGLYIDGQGDIYVADNGNDRIQKWSMPPTMIIDTSIFLAHSTIVCSAIVTDTSGCISSSDTIRVDRIDSSAQTLCPGSTYYFNGQYLQYPGTYYDTLLSSHGCDSVVAIHLTMADSVTAHFTVQPSGTPHLWYVVNQCTGHDLNYVWTWGDGTSGMGDTASHTYASAGSYNICVTATDSAGCAAYYCDTSANIYKNQSGQMVYVNVVSQTANSIRNINTDHQDLSYYSGAVHFAEELQVPVALKLYDLSGRVIMEQNNFTGNKWNIDHGIAEGVYIVHLQNDDYSLSRKIMIIR